MQFLCIEDGQGLFCIFSESYFRLNLKASDRLHLILHDPRLGGELIEYEMLSDEMDLNL